MVLLGLLLMENNNYWQESRKTLWLALPFVANQVLQMSVVTIDSLMAGADSELTLAAVAQGVVLWHVVALSLIGMLMPMTALIAKAHARNDTAQLRELFQQAVWLSVPLGLLGFAIMWLVPGVMVLVDVDAKIIPPATDYLHITAFTLPLIGLFLPIRFLNEGMSKPAVMMWLTATSLPINILGNYIFLNGLFGMPKMGAAGIALATLLAEAYLLAAAWWYTLKHPKMHTMQLLSGFSRPLRPVITRYVRLGVPNAIMLLMESGMFAAVIVLSGRFGVEVAAANQIAFNYASNTFMIPLGISMALSTRIGMAMGNDDLGKARMIGISGMIMGASFMLLSVLTIILFGRDIAMLYNGETAVISTAVSLMALAGIFQIFDGVQVCAAGALRGLEETQAPMRYAAVGYWLLAMPTALVLAFVLELGAPGLWWGLVVGLSVTSVLCARKFLQLTTTSSPHSA